MAGVNTQNYGLLIPKYQRVIAKQVFNKNPLKDSLKFEKFPYGGSHVEYKANVKRSPSGMFVGEDGAFSDADPEVNIPVRVTSRKYMDRTRTTWEVMHDSASSEGAFKASEKGKLKRIVDNAARAEEIALNSDGRGVLALVDDSTPDGAVSLGVDAPGGITGDDFGNRFIQVGQRLGFVNPATNALRSGIRTVVACAEGGGSITLDAVVNSAVADNDYIVVAANTGVTDVLDTSYEKAFWGLPALFDDGTYRNNYFGVDRSRYPANYKSYVRPSTGALSEDIFQQAADVMDQKLGGVTNRLTGHHSVRRLYYQMTRADRRYATEVALAKPDALTVAFKQGDLTVGQVPFKAMRHHPFGMIFGWDSEGVEMYCYWSELGKFVNEDGSDLIRVGYGTAARHSFESWWFRSLQYHAMSPAKAWRLDGITGQSLIVQREAGID